MLDLVEAGRRVAEVPQDLGITEQTIYSWRRQDRIDQGLEPGLSTAERDVFPKRTSVAPFPQADLDAVAAELNGRPRQTLGWMKPSEALHHALR